MDSRRFPPLWLIASVICGGMLWGPPAPGAVEAPAPVETLEDANAVIREEPGPAGQPKRSVIRLREVSEDEARVQPPRFRMPKRFPPKAPLAFEGTIRPANPGGRPPLLLLDMYVIRADGTKVHTMQDGCKAELDGEVFRYRFETKAPGP